MTRTQQTGRGGRGGRGNHGGRGNGHGRGRSNRTNQSRSNSSIPKAGELKFYPQGTGKFKQTVTYAMVKDAIEQHVQKTFRYGLDIAMSLRDMEKIDLTQFKPTRLEVPIGENATAKDIREAEMEQAGIDIEYQEELKIYLERRRVLDENLPKAYAMIFKDYCSEAIKRRVEESKDYESVI